MGLVSYTNIEDGQSADANVFNSRYGDILAQLNGNLDAQNIKNGTLTRELFSNDAKLASWPIDSVYLSVTNVNPSAALGGGTWVQIAQGRALVGVDASDEDFDEAEKTTGAKTVALTAAQNGSHTHSVNPPSTTTSSNGNHNHSYSAWRQSTYPAGGIIDYGGGYGNPPISTGNTSSSGAHTHTVNIPAFNSASSGSGEAHNNVQPSFAIFVWKRVS